MSYQNAIHVLPQEVIDLIQDYIQGEYLYIPKKETQKKTWGENTGIRLELKQRNLAIYEDSLKGLSTKDLADQYFLSEKSIQRILLNERREQMGA